MQERPEPISSSLMHSVTNDYTASGLIDLSEVVLDQTSEVFLQNEAIIKIPILGTLIGLTKGALDFRDRRYASKILSFLAETAKASNQDKDKYKEKLENNPKEAQRAGETVLDIIDKITSTEKAVMIGKVFRAFMHENDMTFTQVLYLCEMIERTYLQDLISLEKSEVHNDVNLENVGIKKPIRSEDVNKLLDIALKSVVENESRNAGFALRGMSPQAPSYPRMEDSGLTDEGYNLVRILREY